MVNWSDPVVVKFGTEATQAQEQYENLLGDREWDLIEKSEETILFQKVGFGLYGSPSSEPSEANLNTGYNVEQVNEIRKISSKLTEGLNFERKNIHFACIFIICKNYEKTFTAAVFKSKGENDSSCTYVDSYCRKYADWNDYLHSNKLPMCIYCFPKRGLYERVNGKVVVQIGTSPACDVVNRLRNYGDVAATVTNAGITTIGLIAFCSIPVAGPILTTTAIAAGLTSTYAIFRGSEELVDRAHHGQSIGLDNSEALSYWLTIVGSSLGFAQGRLISSMTKAAAAGDVMGKAGRIAFLVVQTGNITVNGLGIAHGLAVIIDKSEKNKLEPLDVFQFTTSVLFFTNSVINFKTARTIIKEVQHEIIDKRRQVHEGQARKLFNKHTGKLRGPDELYGNAKVVKTLNRIETSKDLYKMMTDSNVDSHKVKLTEKGFQGLLNVNKNLKIHPLKLLEIPPEKRIQIFDSTKNFTNGAISPAKFKQEMNSICSDYRISFEHMRQDTVNKLCQMYGKSSLTEISVGGRKIFANVSGHDLDRLRVVLENTLNSNVDILKIATEFAKKRNCTSAADFISYTEYASSFISEQTKLSNIQYLEKLEQAKAMPQFNEAKFDRDYGIVGKRKQFFTKEVIKQFSTENGISYLNQQFDTLKNQISPLNKKCEPGFFNDTAATYHYFKHKVIGRELTAQEYFKIAEDVVKTPTNQTNAMLSQDGQCTLITYKDPKHKVFAIKVDKCDGSVIATVMYDPKIV